MKSNTLRVLLIAVCYVLCSNAHAQIEKLQQVPSNTAVKNFMTISFDRSTTTDTDEYEGQTVYSAKRIEKADLINAETYRRLLSKGVKVDGKANHITITMSGYRAYTRAELVYKPTNAVLMELPLTDEDQRVDLSQIPSGDYRMILTNNEGQIKIEKLLIMH